MRSELVFAFAIIGILMMLILPMPTWLLDFGLGVSIAVSVLVLMVVLFIEKPLDLNAFPTILLVTTMLRLGLNLASTRLILSHGHQGTDAAGHVIQAFGNLLMSGNFIIGVIVFAILIIVNFIVITKGSGRIAEVAARFTLDAMPGKQMAIDADLSAGLVTEAEARKRRKELEDEATFFGSMDGAAKFVRGDAIAGLLITFINVIGGILIGVLSHGMTFSSATQTYTLLTIGDGLVTQIPALIISTAAGLLVTKSGSQGSTDKQLGRQLGGYPQALAMAAGLMVLMAVLPGIPTIPFLMIGAALGGVAYMGWKAETGGAAVALDPELAGLSPGEGGGVAPVADEPISSALQIDSIRLELGYGLLSLINSAKGQRLTDQIKALRRQLASELGFVMPSVRIQDNLQLAANTYVVRIKEIEAGRGDLRPNMLLVMDPRGEPISLPGETTTEPTFGLPAMWIAENNREEALFRGYTVVDPPTVVTTHLTEIVKENMSELLSYSETQKLLNEVEKDAQKLVADVVPTMITINGLQRVLQNLLSERVSVRDMPAILEAISEATQYTRSINTITEHVRSRLARQISESNASDGGVLPIVTLSPEWEQIFSDSLVGGGEERQLSMQPSQLQRFISAVRQTFDRFAVMGETPVLLTSPAVRPYVRSIIERFRPSTIVLSQAEIHPKAKIKTLGQI
ncbi:flagellar biosynthesis protein FlhA [Lacibacterium aquatile]|uniref:Flagellar biosynthesis protein FlhA n=1 Tax=Lacibacterium aquatile TaxID=1168082 RepID=A0ABW5DVJ5_9PROT